MLTTYLPKYLINKNIKQTSNGSDYICQLTFHSLKKPEPKKNKVRMGVLLNNETVKEIANIGAGLNNINDTSSKKEATVFVVLDMHPGLMNPTETLGRYYCTTVQDTITN